MSRARHSVAMSTDDLLLCLAIFVMVVCWLLANRSHWFMLGSVGACLLGALYFFSQGRRDLWVFGAVQLFWAAVSLWRWWKVRKRTSPVS